MFKLVVLAALIIAACAMPEAYLRVQRSPRHGGGFGFSGSHSRAESSSTGFGGGSDGYPGGYGGYPGGYGGYPGGYGGYPGGYGGRPQFGGGYSDASAEAGSFGVGFDWGK